MKSFILFAVVSVAATALHGQSVLDAYIREGLGRNNMVLQKELSVRQAHDALRIARSYFLPSVTFNGDYLSGKGGRSIDIPIGDLLNPVYTSLNQLTASDAFPQVRNVQQDFFPYDFYDARVRTSLPIVNSDLWANRSISAQQHTMRGVELELYKRQLVLEIKVAYFTYLSSLEAVRIHEGALRLVRKNVEVNESLVRNGSGLPANLMRAKSEARRLEADLNSARNQSVNAQRYFNFLLNRGLGEPIDASYRPALPADTTSFASATGAREEITLLHTAQGINHSVRRMTQWSRLPRVNAFLDLGSQASNWHFDDQSRYYFAGVQVSIPLFQGFRTSLQHHQQTLAIEKTAREIDHVSDQLDLAREAAHNDYRTAIENHHAAREQLSAAESYFRLIDKGYQQGVNSLIEFLDARNQLTTSELQVNLSGFQALMAAAKVERETASYPLNN